MFEWINKPAGTDIWVYLRDGKYEVAHIVTFENKWVASVDFHLAFFDTLEQAQQAIEKVFRMPFELPKSD